MANPAASVHSQEMTSPALYMDAVITQNRSLSRKGLFVLMGIFAAANLLIAVFLLSIGAIPVPIFLGLDFVGLFIAFRVSNRRAAVAERVRVSADRVEVLREANGEGRTIWTSPTAFTQVSFEESGRGSRLRLRRAGQAMTLARSLAPEERSAFADALRAAIQAARHERYPS